MTESAFITFLSEEMDKEELLALYYTLLTMCVEVEENEDLPDVHNAVILELSSIKDNTRRLH